MAGKPTRLRKAMEKAQVNAADICTETGVHVKTVERWIRGERVPQPRYRQAVGDLVGEEAYVLWPDSEVPITGIDVTAEILAAYPHRADTPVDRWWAMIEAADAQIDFLGFAMQFLPEQHPHLMPVLKEKAASGCQIRVALCDPDSRNVEDRDAEEALGGTLAARIRTSLKHFQPLRDVTNASVHLHDSPMYNSVFRCDDDMFVTPHLYGLSGYAAPLLHIRKLGQGGLFDSFADHFENLWETTRPAYEDR